MKTLALISPNQRAYSETFIHMQLRALPATRILLHGGYFPTQFSLEPDFEASEPLPSSPPKRSLIDRIRRVSQAEAQANAQHEALASFLKARKVDVVLAQYGPTGVAVMAACQRARIPLFVHFHGYDAYRSDILQAQGQLYPALFQTAEGIVCVSTHMQAQLRMLGAPEDKLHLIPYGVELPRSPAHAADPNLLIAVGRMVEKKGPLLTLEAFRQVWRQRPEARLCMVGDGPLMGDCETFVEAYGMQAAVEFAGVLSHAEVHRRMAGAAVFVQHSLHAEDGDMEGLPLAVLEAMAAGLPVVATLHAGIPDAVQHGVEGFLCVEGDAERMAAHLLQLLDDAELRARMGAAARDRVAFFSVEKYIGGLARMMGL